MLRNFVSLQIAQSWIGAKESEMPQEISEYGVRDFKGGDKVTYET